MSSSFYNLLFHLSSIVFLYNTVKEFEKKKSGENFIDKNHKKVPWINLTKEVKDIYSENLRTLQKEIEARRKLKSL